MFDLTSGKGNKSEEFIFDLEKELKDEGKKAKIKDLLESRIQKLKSAMRGGEDKEQYDKLGTLLYGYAALQKVFNRISNKDS